jgi:hypothetical protein
VNVRSQRRIDHVPSRYSRGLDVEHGIRIEPVTQINWKEDRRVHENSKTTMSAATAPSPRLYHRTQTRPNHHPTQVNPRGDLATPPVLLGASVDLSIERCDQVFQVLALLLQLCKPGLVGQRLCRDVNVFWYWTWTNLLGCEPPVQAPRNTFACLNSFCSQNDQKSCLHSENSSNRHM